MKAFAVSLLAVLSLVMASVPAQGQNYSVLYTFKDGTRGSTPVTRLVLGKSGTLYGTTGYTVFKLKSGGGLTVLHEFVSGEDGGYSGTSIIRDKAGNLYGTSAIGGNGTGCGFGVGCGVVFKVDPSGAETDLYSFSGGSDGAVPLGVVHDKSGNLYGTTRDGGYHGSKCNEGCGVVFNSIRRAS